MIISKNKVMNLTADSSPEEIEIKHFADSSAILCDLNPDGESIIDVGCGAGLPGLAIKMLRPAVKMTELDSTAKKVAFVSEVIAALNLDDAVAISGRAEEIAKGGHRETFDRVITRAVADLSVLAEICLPLVKVGGYLSVWKLHPAKQELANAASAMEALGGALAGINSYVLPGVERERCIIHIKKISHSSPKYPRIYGQIKKYPI